MRLFTIGDSISQGFMSAAAARTDLSYSTLIASTPGFLAPTESYHIPVWEKGGLPVNLEKLMRKLSRLYGSDISGLFEWSFAAYTISSFLDDVEDYYERGAGAETVPDSSGHRYFHNIAVRGFDVADAWKVTPKLCRERITLDNAQGRGKDDAFGRPNASFYRTALNVLNPSRDSAFDDYSPLRWLAAHATGETGEAGVENLILWLGANNALGTIVDLKIVPTSNDPSRRPVDMTQPERVDYNLWHPDDFAAEYRELLDRVDAIMADNVAKDWRVFVGNVPPVTVAPLAKGVGDTVSLADPFGYLGGGALYYRYYTYFIFDEDFAHTSDIKLTRDQVYHIDRTIAAYNQIISEVVKSKNASHRRKGKKQRYFIVDIAKLLLELAFKRNNGQPTYRLPPYLDGLSPKPNTKYYHATKRGRVEQGGIFSLDGVHPSAMGQGLLAQEFLSVMEAQGVVGAVPANLNWNQIVARDALWSHPISLMRELYQHERLAEVLVNFIR